jgi:hypothetical protein
MRSIVPLDIRVSCVGGAGTHAAATDAVAIDAVAMMGAVDDDDDDNDEDPIDVYIPGGADSAADDPSMGGTPAADVRRALRTEVGADAGGTDMRVGCATGTSGGTPIGTSDTWEVEEADPGAPSVMVDMVGTGGGGGGTPINTPVAAMDASDAAGGGGGKHISGTTEDDDDEEEEEEEETEPTPALECAGGDAEADARAVASASIAPHSGSPEKGSTCLAKKRLSRDKNPSRSRFAL